MLDSYNLSCNSFSIEAASGLADSDGEVEPSKSTFIWSLLVTSGYFWLLKGATASARYSRPSTLPGSVLLGRPAPYRAPPQLILPRGAPHPSKGNLTEGNQADQAKKRRDYRYRVIVRLFIFSPFETYLLNAPHD